jgi:hypothetical protein
MTPAKPQRHRRAGLLDVQDRDAPPPLCATASFQALDARRPFHKPRSVSLPFDRSFPNMRPRILPHRRQPALQSP